MFGVFDRSVTTSICLEIDRYEKLHKTLHDDTVATAHINNDNTNDMDSLLLQQEAFIQQLTIQDDLVTQLETHNISLLQQLSALSLKHDTLVHQTTDERNEYIAIINKLKFELHAFKVPSKKSFFCRFCDIKQSENDILLAKFSKYEMELQNTKSTITDLLLAQSELENDNILYLNELKQIANEKSQLDVNYTELQIIIEQLNKDLVTLRAKLSTSSKDCVHCKRHVSKTNEMKQAITVLESKINSFYDFGLSLNNSSSDIGEGDLDLLRMCCNCHQKRLTAFVSLKPLLALSKKYALTTGVSDKPAIVAVDMPCGNDQNGCVIMGGIVGHQIDYLLQQNYYLNSQKLNLETLLQQNVQAIPTRWGYTVVSSL